MDAGARTDLRRYVRGGTQRRPGIPNWRSCITGWRERVGIEPTGARQARPSWF